MSVAHPAQRVLSRSEWRPIAVERNGTEPFVGELRVSVLGLPVCWDGSQGCLITRLFEV